MDIRDRKRAIRRDVVARVLAMDPADRLDQEHALHGRFPALPGFADARVVLLYVAAFPEEFATRPLLDRTLELGKRLACPRVNWRTHTLELCELADPGRDLAPGRRGIPEPSPSCPEVDPAAIDWVLVPGLAFDRRGHRLGRGAGHYDRLLPTLRPDVQRWALILDAQWVDVVPTEPHDQPLDGVADAREVVTSPRT